MKTLLALLLLIPSLSWGLDVGNGSLGEWHKELTSKLGSNCDFLGIERNDQKNIEGYMDRKNKKGKK